MRRTRPDQAEGLRRLQSHQPACGIIAVAAAADSVGKRTVAVNLATTLAAGGRKVVLLQGTPLPGAACVRHALGAVVPKTLPQATHSLCAQLDALSATLLSSSDPTVAALDAPELFLGLQLWRSTQLNQVRGAMMRVSAAADVLVVDTPVDTPCGLTQTLGVTTRVTV
jgi:MinD-like ATPase involved in chromosome partitioning or flagellar assembly